MIVLIQLLVDRSASPFAGLRLAILTGNSTEAKHQRFHSCEASRPSFPHAAKRLRSTSSLERMAGERAWFIGKRTDLNRLSPEALAVVGFE